MTPIPILNPAVVPGPKQPTHGSAPHTIEELANIFPGVRVSDEEDLSHSTEHICERCGKPKIKILGVGDREDQYICRSCREPGRPLAPIRSY